MSDPVYQRLVKRLRIHAHDVVNGGAVVTDLRNDIQEAADALETLFASPPPDEPPPPRSHRCGRCNERFACQHGPFCEAGDVVMPNIIQPDGSIKAHCPLTPTWDWIRGYGDRMRAQGHIEHARVTAEQVAALNAAPPNEPPPLREPDHDADCAVQKGPSKMNRLVCTCAQPAPPNEPDGIRDSHSLPNNFVSGEARTAPEPAKEPQ